MANNLALGIVIGATVSGTVGRAFESLGTRATRLGQSLERVQLGRNAAQDVIRYRTQLDNLNTVQRQVGAGNAYLEGQIDGTGRALRNAEQAAGRYGLNIGNIVRENRLLMESEARLGRQLGRTNTLRENRNRRGELQGQMAGTIGLAYAATAPIKSAIEFESVMADVRKVVEVSDAEFKGLGKSILDMSATMPMAASGIGAIVAAAGQSGVAKNELLGFTQAAVKMGIAFDMTGEEAGQTLAGWRAGMALNQKQAESLADAINHLDSNMNASAKSIAEVVQRQGAVAKAAGLNEIQIAALGAALLNSGAPAEIAATALKNLTNALTKGGSATKSQIEVFDQLGMTSEAVTASMQKDAEGTIKKVFAALAKAPAENRGALVGDLFGEEAKGAIMPLLVNMKAMEQAFDSVGDASQYAGSMQKEYDIRSQTTANNLQLLGNQATRLGVNLGSLLLPTLNGVFGVVGGMVGGVTGLAEKFPVLTQVVVGAAVGLIGLKVAALATGYAATLISDGWVVARAVMDFFRLSTMQANAALVVQKAQVIGSAIAQQAMAVWTGTVTAAQWLWNAALTANPIGMVIVGIAAFGALAFTVYKNWEPITAWFTTAWAAIGTAADVVGAAVGGAFTSAANVVMAAWAGVMDWLAGKFAWVMEKVNWVKGLGGSLFAKGAVIGGAMATAVAMPAGATPLPPLPGAKAPQTVNQTTNATIHITQKPGEDANGLAERVASKLKRQQAADARGALHD